MDLLNSILNSMEPIPAANEEQKKILKKQKELAEREKNKRKEELLRFRKFCEERLQRFAKDDRPHIEFQPLDKVHRSVIHEIAEHGGFLALSFGREEVDRYSVVYKKENAPTEDEISARRNGDGWNEEVSKEYAERRKLHEIEKEQKRLAKLQAVHETRASTESEVKPNSNYKDKYAHLIGQESALQARKTETNQSYGFVPSKNKKDIRSIEQTLADIQAKKKRKLQQEREAQEQEQEQVEHQHQQNEETECDVNDSLDRNHGAQVEQNQ